MGIVIKPPNTVDEGDVLILTSRGSLILETVRLRPLEKEIAETLILGRDVILAYIRRSYIIFVTRDRDDRGGIYHSLRKYERRGGSLIASRTIHTLDPDQIDGLLKRAERRAKTIDQHDSGVVYRW